MSILQMSIIAGVLIIAIVIIHATALNRLPKKMFLVLWGVVLVRLLIPVSIPININNNAIGDILERVLLISEYPIFIDGMTQVPEQPAGTGFNIAAILWLAGMVIVFTFLAVIYSKNHRLLRCATLIKDNDFLNNWLKENKIIRPITIMQSDRINSPFAVGIIRPRIILPISMDMNDKQLLDYVLAHEYYHIKRFDALLKMILLAALCVHWFNPMVWVMFILANRDLELTCDEAVIHRLGSKTKQAYAYMLIGMAESKFAPLYNGFSKNATEERIVSIMKMKKSSIMRMISAVVLVSVLTIGAFTVFAGNGSQREHQVHQVSIYEILPYITPDTQFEHRFAIADLYGNITYLTKEEFAEKFQSGTFRVICFSSFTDGECISPFCNGEHLNESDFTYEEWQYMKSKFLPRLDGVYSFDDIPSIRDLFPWFGN